MKKLLGSLRKKEQPSGSRSEASSLGGGVGCGYELRRKGLSKLHRAAACGDMRTLSAQVKKLDLNQLDKAHRTPLHLACAYGSTNAVTFLVDKKCQLNLCDNDGRSPLIKAVQCQEMFCVGYLLQHDADPNVVDLDSNTALHFAASNFSISIAEKLLEYNANIDALNKDGNTPLMLAVAGSKQEMAEFLLKKGASVHIKDNSGRTPLMTAAANEDDALLSLLIQYGADVSDKNIHGWKAEDYAQKGGYPELTKKLIRIGSEKDAKKSSESRSQSIFSSPDGDAGLTLGAPATNKEVVEDVAGESLSTSSGNSWRSDDEPFSSPKIGELSHQLEVELSRCTQLESTNRDLREQLSSVKTLQKNNEELKRSKLQLEDEVSHLKRDVQSNMLDCNQREQFKREVEERARQELKQKLEEVNLFLQTQAASQESLEQIRATNNACLKNQLEQSSHDLETELGKLKNIQQDYIFHRESTHTELERYKVLYLEELKMRKALKSKLDR